MSWAGVDWTACDWGGFASVLDILRFWGRWFASSLQHTPRGTELQVVYRFYATADPLASALAVCLLLAALCFLLSLPTNRHSWVDKLWSIAPVFYVWHFALHDQIGGGGVGAKVPLSPRLLAMSALATLWGPRLTWNFARKGGYRWQDEDYRWPWLRERIHPFLFLVFNLTFIATIQHIFLLWLTTPAYLAWQNVGRPLNALDALATALVASFILMEGVADQQQWQFQTAKHALLAAKKALPPAYKRGFCTTGLFRYSRHPNFWAEQAIWWSFYLFGVAASGRWLNWTLAGPILLSALFQGSTWLTEKITAAKYPAYASYQKTTSRLMPWFPGEPAAPAQAVAAAKEDGEAGPSRRARSSSRSRKPAGSKAASTPVTPKAAAEETEGEEEAQETKPTRGRRAAAPRSAAATTATKRRTGRAAAKAAPAEEDEEAEEAPTAAKRRPARSPRKTAKAAAAEEEAAGAVRKSTRLRTKA